MFSHDEWIQESAALALEPFINKWEPKDECGDDHWLVPVKARGAHSKIRHRGSAPSPGPEKGKDWAEVAIDGKEPTHTELPCEPALSLSSKISKTQLRVGLCHMSEMSTAEALSTAGAWGWWHWVQTPWLPPLQGCLEPPCLTPVSQQVWVLLLCCASGSLIARMRVVLPPGLWRMPGFSSVFACPKKAVEEERFVLSYQSWA